MISIEWRVWLMIVIPFLAAFIASLVWSFTKIALAFVSGLLALICMACIGAIIGTLIKEFKVNE